MSNFQGLGANFDDAGLQGFQSSVSGGSASSPFAQASGASSHTSISLSSNVCLPPSTTHDTTRSHHHMEDFERFLADIQLSAKRAFPNSAYSRYKQVEALLIRWEEDELAVRWELDKLQLVLRDMYGFSTEQYLIPTQKSHRQLNRKLLSFVEEHEDEDTLLIVYYGGHGAINRARQSTWSCKADKTHATVEWSAIQTLLEEVKCDVLLLLDCCAGASAAPLTERPSNIKETIAACGFETWAPNPGAQSFTHTLIEVMEEWAPQLPFSAAMLHSEVLTRLKHAQPRLSSQGAREESRRTPVYIVSTPDPHTASITLGRLLEDKDMLSMTSSQGVPDSIPTSLSKRVQADGCVSLEDRLKTLMAMDDQGQRQAPHVLLTIALEEDQVFDTAGCARWLKQFPLLAKFASIEGVYRSYSTLVLLSVPVVLWNLLPDHPASQFVGYVRSCNLLQKEPCPEELVHLCNGVPIPITKQASRGKPEYCYYECTSAPKSISHVSSLDSGYDSSIPRPKALVSLRRAQRRVDDVDVGFKNMVVGEVSVAEMRRPKSARKTEHLSRARPTSSPASEVSKLDRKTAIQSTSPKRLIVTVTEARLEGDKTGTMCVLWYGNEVQRGQPARRATTKPVWSEEFRFDVIDSPMFYHLRLSVWGDSMLELIGELQIDLREMVKKGKTPELNEWQNLRCDGKKAGLIRLRLVYLDSHEDDEHQAKEVKAMVMQSEQQKQQLEQEQIEQQQGNDGRARFQQMDFRVW